MIFSFRVHCSVLAIVFSHMLAWSNFVVTGFCGTDIDFLADGHLFRRRRSYGNNLFLPFLNHARIVFCVYSTLFFQANPW